MDLKTKYGTDKTELENKIPDTAGLVKKTDYNAKITKIESKIPSINGLATNAALTVVENKIPNIGSLVKKVHHNTKITEIEKKCTDHNHDKYITTPEFNTSAANIFNARLAQANLIRKTDFDATLSSLNRKLQQINQNICLSKINKKTKNIWFHICFRGKSYFVDNDGTKNYLVFQPINIYFKVIANTNYISPWTVWWKY